MIASPTPVSRPRFLRLPALSALFGLSLFWVSCAGPQVAPPKEGPRSADAILALALARPLPKTLQGMTRLETFVQGEARKADLLIRIARPDRAQFQVLSPTMDLIAVMATDGQRFVSFERGADRCFLGRACPANLARLVPIALPPRELVEALLGRPPLLKTKNQQIAWDGARGAWKIELGAPSARHRQQVWVQPGSWRFLASVLYDGDKRVASIAYGDVGTPGALMPAGRMRLRIPAQKVDMSIELRDVSLDEAIEKEAFSLPCPAGTMRVVLPCAVSPQSAKSAESAEVVESAGDGLSVGGDNSGGEP